MSDVSVATFEKAILKELWNNNLSIFAGAGLSMGSGFVDWKGLLRDIASQLDLNIDKESDLVAIAQYHYNIHGRQTINEAIIEQFEKNASKNENMNILSRLPIDTYWTTNYDSIIEETLSDTKKVVDKKVDQSQIKNYKPNRNVVVYKMHGDKDYPDDAVITRDDYEGYERTRPLFTTQLKGELLSKTFLFIGFSFEDPNLEQILSKVRIDLLGKSPKNHYCFFRRVCSTDSQYKNQDGLINMEQYQYDVVKQKLKIKDLKRFGINAVLVDEYPDITSILGRIEKKYKLNKIFISGSAEEYGEFSQESATDLLHNLSGSIVKNNQHVISGFGLGVGSYIINGALEEIYQNKSKHTNDFLTLRPFPQGVSGGRNLKDLWTEYRKDMIDDAGVVLFLFGNKKDDLGNVILANGVMEEFEIAKDLGKVIIPIGVTGYCSAQILAEVKGDIDKYWYIKDSVDVLENERDHQKIIREINIIIDRVKVSMNLGN